jgi:hypothetical protein
VLVHNVATIALKAAFLFLDVVDLTSFKAADLTRFVLDNILFLAGLRLTVVCFSAVSFTVVLRFLVVRFTVVLRFLFVCFFEVAIL